MADSEADTQLVDEPIDNRVNNVVSNGQLTQHVVDSDGPDTGSATTSVSKRLANKSLRLVCTRLPGQNGRHRDSASVDSAGQGLANDAASIDNTSSPSSCPYPKVFVSNEDQLEEYTPNEVDGGKEMDDGVRENLPITNNPRLPFFHMEGDVRCLDGSTDYNKFNVATNSQDRRYLY